MKLVKLATDGNGHEINTSIVDKGAFHIGMEAIEVADDIADALHEQFGHLIEITEKVVEAVEAEIPVDNTASPETEQLG